MGSPSMKQEEMLVKEGAKEQHVTLWMSNAALLIKNVTCATAQQVCADDQDSADCGTVHVTS